MTAQSSGLGNVLRTYRYQHRISQATLAHRIGHGMSQADISRLENGHIDLPRRERLERISRVLGIGIGDLLMASGWHTRVDLAVVEVRSQPNGDGYTARHSSLPEPSADFDAAIAEIGADLRDIRAMLDDLTKRLC